MPVKYEAERGLMGRQMAFEVAAALTAGVGIMINMVRQLYVACLR